MKTLYRLQQVDLKIQETQEKLTGLSVSPDIQIALGETLTRLTKAEEELRQVTKSLKTAELDLASKEVQKKDLDRKLYGGMIVNPKELNGMQKDIETVLSQKGALEEKILGMWDRIEELKSLVQQQQYLLKEHQQSLIDATAATDTQRKELEASLVEMKAKRQLAADDVEESLRKKYENIRSKKDGLAVVGINRGNCKGCGMTVPPSSITKLYDGQIESCKNCGRLLITEYQ